MESAVVPSVILLHGSDEFALHEYLAGLKRKVGDAPTADLNTIELDGRTVTMATLGAACGALPFLAKRRLVIVDGLLARLTGKGDGESTDAPGRKRALAELIAVLDQVPDTTALVLTERRELPAGHALLRWAAQAGGRAFVRAFDVPKGVALAQWISARARALGGAFRPQAAQRLANAVVDDPRLAAQEIVKLLTFVNFERPVEVDDVERLVPYGGGADVFAMVDALGGRDARRALEHLHRLLQSQDAAYAFAMAVRQFRLLLQVRELIDGGAKARDVAQQLRLPPFVAGKLVAQAGNFNLADLERAYRRLLDLDLAIKSGQTDGAVALDVLVAELAMG